MDWCANNRDMMLHAIATFGTMASNDSGRVVELRPWQARPAS
jgi:hypothetical protein